MSSPSSEHAKDYCKWYLDALGARVVAESGRAADRLHLGKLVLRALRDAPEFVLQIDGGTGQSETCGSVLERSVQCARALRSLGAAAGDVIVLMAPNHLDLCIPYYAALYLGAAVAPIDMNLGVNELYGMFLKDEPKVVFCQSERAEAVRTALDKAQVKSTIVTFDGTATQYSTVFADLLKKHGQGQSVEDFKASDFDPATTLSFLISTSGSTGLPKQAAHTHETMVLSSPYVWMKHSQFPTPTRLALAISPLQWNTALLQMNLSCLLRYTRIQSSKTMDTDHIFEIINTYKPSQMLISPTLLTTLTKHSQGRCDWTSFDTILVGGEAVSKSLLNNMKDLSPNTDVFNMYGMSEMGAISFNWTRVPGSCGQPSGLFEYRLVNRETGKDVLEPNVPGELWVAGPPMFKGYYKDAAVTQQVMTSDGWFKTGDLFRRDQHWNYFFVERIKMLLKYKNHQVSPEEIQAVIRRHPAVLDAAVCGLPHDECGDLPAAAVVRRAGCHVTARVIKDLVKESLADTKQLRGGVVFLPALPQLPNGKTDHKKVKELMLSMERE